MAIVDDKAIKYDLGSGRYLRELPGKHVVDLIDGFEDNWSGDPRYGKDGAVLARCFVYDGSQIDDGTHSVDFIPTSDAARVKTLTITGVNPDFLDKLGEAVQIVEGRAASVRNGIVPDDGLPQLVIEVDLLGCDYGELNVETAYSLLTRLKTALTDDPSTHVIVSTSERVSRDVLDPESMQELFDCPLFVEEIKADDEDEGDGVFNAVAITGGVLAGLAIIAAAIVSIASQWKRLK